MDDFSSDQTTTGTVTTGMLSHGEIETVGDTDWFAVSLEAGRYYHFQIYGSGTLNNGYLGKSLTGMDVNLHTPDLNPWSRAYGPGGLDAKIGMPLLAGQTGVHYLSVGGLNGATGTYAVEMHEIAEENGNTQADTLDLSLNETLYLLDNSKQGYDPVNQISTGLQWDQDWLRVDLEAGKTYELSVDRAPFRDGNHIDVRSSVIAPSGDVLGGTPNTEPDFDVETDTFTATETGTHFVHILGSSGRIPNFQHYSVTLREAITLTGTDGDDWLTASFETGYPVAVSGGDGQDMISFAALDYNNPLGEGVLISLGNGMVSAPTPANMFFVMDSIEHATGSNFADTFYGHDGNERLRGLGGNDTFFSSEGSDRIDGGSGWDTMDFRFSDAGVSASLLRGRGWSGDAAGDRYSGIEQVNGSFHDDILWGDHGNNRLDGSHGDDTLIGNGGDDILIAGFGEDVIVYAGNRADYEVTQAGFRTDVTHLNDGADGHDVILHGEVLRFADGDLLL